MIKQLLVGLDGSEYMESVIRYGIDLARLHDARLQGAAIVDSAGIEESYHTPRPLGAGSFDSDLYKRHLEESRKKAESLLSKFTEICRKEDVKFDGRLEEGSPGHILLKLAGLNDLLILGKQTKFSFRIEEDEFCPTCDEVLEKSSRPLLMVPEKHRPINKVMIAVDFYRLADRLLHNFVHLNLFPDCEVHLVHVSGTKKKDSEIPSELIDYFKVHDFDVVPVILHGDHAGQAVVNYAHTEGMDLLVMGIHSVSKVWRVLLGSTSRYVLENIEIPVLTQT